MKDFLVIMRCRVVPDGGDVWMRTEPLDAARALGAASRIEAGQVGEAAVVPATRWARDHWPEMGMTSVFLTGLEMMRQPQRFPRLQLGVN